MKKGDFTTLGATAHSKEEREEDKPRDVRNEEGVYIAFNISYDETVGYELSMVNPLIKEISLFNPIFSKYEVVQR